MTKILKFNRRSVLAGMGVLSAATMVPTFAFSKQLLRLSTLGPGTSPNLVMTTFANVVNNALDDYEIQVNATGAATRHVLEVAKGKTTFCMSSPTIHFLMRKRLAMYAKIETAPELVKNLRTVFNFPMGVYHIAVFEKSGIKQIADAKGKRVFLGPPGGAAFATMKRLFMAVSGLEEGKDYQAVKLSWDAASAAFQDGNIDVYCNPTNAPSPALSQITLTNSIRFLGIPKDKLENKDILALTKRPGFSLANLSKTAYGDNQANDEDVITLGVVVSVVTHKDADQKMIYNMTKVFFETLVTLQKNAPWLKGISLKGAIEDINLPLHVGALEALEELGLFIPLAVKSL
ncbi:MAG: TAXI family TRAP transporter solute-binding subunit [Rhizobiales bacterium]|nr:TAXI family TRAP transporter solute-binding subunit [Hyphomicrobiales bacterium]